MNQETINYITFFFIALASIYMAGALLYKHESEPLKEKNPIYLAMGFGLAGLGGGLIIKLLEKVLLPQYLKKKLESI